MAHPLPSLASAPSRNERPEQGCCAASCHPAALLCCSASRSPPCVCDYAACFAHVAMRLAARVAGHVLVSVSEEVSLGTRHRKK